MCRPKDQGGLGIIDLEIQNICFLSKWLFKLINEDGIWLQLIKISTQALRPLRKSRKKPGDSHFWSGLMNVKNDFLGCVTFKIQNGKQVRFQEDKWMGNTSFSEQYLNLFNLIFQKHDTVQKVLATTRLNISFRRALRGNNLKYQHDLVAKVVDVQLVNQLDMCIWSLHNSGKFSIHSMYRALLDESVLPINKYL